MPLHIILAMQTVVEMTTYLKAASAQLGGAERTDLVTAITSDVSTLYAALQLISKRELQLRWRQTP